MALYGAVGGIPKTQHRGLIPGIGPLFSWEHRGGATGQGARAVGSRCTRAQNRDALQQRPQGAGHNKAPRKVRTQKDFCCVKLNASNNGQVARSFLPPQGRGSLQGFGGFLCRGATPGDGRRYYRHPPPSAGRGRRDGFSDKIENFFSISLRRPENLSRRRGST